MALQIVMCATAQWMLLMHRTAVTAEAIENVTQTSIARSDKKSRQEVIEQGNIEHENIKEEHIKHENIDHEQKDGWMEENPSPLGGVKSNAFEEPLPDNRARVESDSYWGTPLGMYTIWPNAKEAWQWGVYLSFLAFAIAVMVGVWLASTTRFARLDITGLASDLDGNGGNSKEIKLTTFPFESTRKLGDQAKINFSKGLYFWLFLIAPTAAGVCAIILWTVPLRPESQKPLLAVLEFCSGWSCLELFFITSSISLYSQKVTSSQTIHSNSHLYFCFKTRLCAMLSFKVFKHVRL